MQVLSTRHTLSRMGKTEVQAMAENILDIGDRNQFREWLTLHAADETECWLDVKRGRPSDPGTFYYIDAVEEALCFGWIDSTHMVIDGRRMQRFSPRKNNSLWTERNKERVRRLEKLGMMTDAGRAVLPAMGSRSFRIDPDIESALKASRCWSKFKSFPPLYQRVRAYNIAFYKNRDWPAYEKSLLHLIEETKKGRMFGEWDDYGRLSDYRMGETRESFFSYTCQSNARDSHLVVYIKNNVNKAI